MQQSQSVTQNKIFFRKIAKETRKILLQKKELSSVSNKIVEKIRKSQFFLEANNILIFYPKKDEIDLRDLLNENKNFFLPRCEEKNLDICPFKDKKDLVLGSYGIYEPKTEKIDDLSIIDIIFIPALCADKNFNRIGYGGGFYDRFLSNKTIKAKKVIVIPDELLYNDIPFFKTDIKSDLIITQSLILSCNIS